MQSFFFLFTRYLSERAKSQDLCVSHSSHFFVGFLNFGDSRDWDRIKSPAEDQIVPYSKLHAGDASNLAKLAVLKVNGGLGTSMGGYHSSRSSLPIPIVPDNRR